jgi:exosome complex component CSL4
MSLVCPGDELGLSTQFKVGSGTYEWDGKIMASLVGVRRDVNGTLTVVTHEQDALIPVVGDVVLARITKVNPRFATARLLTVRETPLRGIGFGAMIRVQDVRLTEVDKVQIYNSFRPGDVVRAEVLSLGENFCVGDCG